MNKVYVLRWDDPDEAHGKVRCIYATLEDAQGKLAEKWIADMGWCHTSYGWFIEEWSVGFLEPNAVWRLTSMGWGKRQ